MDYSISRRLLLDLLNGRVVVKDHRMPDDAEIVAVHHSWERDSFVTRVKSATFDEVWAGEEVPCAAFAWNCKIEPVQCPDCKGTGVYQGLQGEEPCKRCCG
jgi:hypothetical protein